MEQVKKRRGYPSPFTTASASITVYGFDFFAAKKQSLLKQQSVWSQKSVTRAKQSKFPSFLWISRTSSIFVFPKELIFMLFAIFRMTFIFMASFLGPFAFFLIDDFQGFFTFFCSKAALILIRSSSNLTGLIK